MNNQLKFERQLQYIIPGSNKTRANPTQIEWEKFEEKMQSVFGEFVQEINLTNGYIEWDMDQGRISGKLVNVTAELLDKIYKI